jgi:hypothetical protein
VTMGLVAATLRTIGQPAERVIVYAWHPLPIFEFGGSGHIDALMICFIALALFARAHQKFGIAGFCSWSGDLSQILSCRSATKGTILATFRIAATFFRVAFSRDRSHSTIGRE